MFITKCSSINTIAYKYESTHKSGILKYILEIIININAFHTILDHIKNNYAWIGFNDDHELIKNNWYGMIILMIQIEEMDNQTIMIFVNKIMNILMLIILDNGQIITIMDLN